MSRDPDIRGESGIRGESASRERTALAQELEALGHGGCAFDLEAADDCCVVAVAYQIVEHLQENCGAPREQDQDVAERLKRWADAQDQETA
jgi:hypothetical protein